VPKKKFQGHSRVRPNKISKAQQGKDSKKFKRTAGYVRKKIQGHSRVSALKNKRKARYSVAESVKRERGQQECAEK